MRFGVSSIVFLEHLHVLEKLLRTTSLLDHVEMYFSERFSFFHEKLNEFRHLHYEHGLTYSLHLPSHGRSNQICLEWKQQKQRKIWSLELGRKLDIKHAVVHVPCQHFPPQTQCSTYHSLLMRLAENINLLADECASRGMILYIENTIPNLFFHDYHHFLNLFKEVDQQVMFCNDIGHAYLSFGSDNEQLLEFSEKLAKKTGMLHVYQTTDYFNYKRNYKQILDVKKTPKDGYIDYERLKRVWKTQKSPIRFIIQELGKEMIGNEDLIKEGLQNLRIFFSDFKNAFI